MEFRPRTIIPRESESESEPELTAGVPETGGERGQNSEQAMDNLPMNVCINCTEPFGDGDTGTNRLEIDFLDADGFICGHHEVSILEALHKVLYVPKEFRTSKAGMCVSCAEALSYLYTYFVNLVDLSKRNAAIFTLTRQFRAQVFGKHRSYSNAVLVGRANMRDRDKQIRAGTMAPINRVVKGSVRRRGLRTSRSTSQPKSGTRTGSSNTSQDGSSPSGRVPKSKAWKRKREASNDDSNSTDDSPPKPKARKMGQKSFQDDSSTCSRTENENDSSDSTPTVGKRERNRIRARRRRQMESPEQRAFRLSRDAERKRRKRQRLQEARERELRARAEAAELETASLDSERDESDSEGASAAGPEPEADVIPPESPDASGAQPDPDPDSNAGSSSDSDIVQAANGPGQYFNDPIRMPRSDIICESPTSTQP